MADNVRVKLYFDSKCFKYSECIPAQSCWILVDKSQKTVEDIAEKIRICYKMQKHVHLFVDDSQLPTWESSKIFRENDIVVVKTKRKHQLPTVTCDLSTASKANHQYRTSKRKREAEESYAAVSEPASPAISKETPPKPSLVQVIDVQGNKIQNSVLSHRKERLIDEAQLDDSTGDSSVKRRRRKRTRKRNQSKKDDAGQEGEGDAERQVTASLPGNIKRLHISQQVAVHSAAERKDIVLEPGHVVFAESESDSADEVEMQDASEANDENQVNGTEAPGACTDVPNATIDVPDATTDAQNISTECEAFSISNFNRTPSVTEDTLRRIHGDFRSPSLKTISSTPICQGDDQSATCDIFDILQTAIDDKHSKYAKKKGKVKPSDLVQNATVFSRKNMKRKPYCSLTKAQQLASRQENVSIALQNGDAFDTGADVGTGKSDKKPEQPSCHYSDKELASLPTVKDPAKPGQLVAFKMLELSENFTPEVSSYKVAKILEYDQHKKCFSLELLVGKVGGMLLDDSESIQKLVTVQWSSMMEPKVVKA